MRFVALDAHKRYSFASVEDADGRIIAEGRIPHRRGAISEALAGLEPGTPVAVERGYVTQEQLNEALDHQRKMHDEFGMDQSLEHVLDDGNHCRSAARHPSAPARRDSDHGFRAVVSLTPEQAATSSREAARPPPPRSFGNCLIAPASLAC